MPATEPNLTPEERFYEIATILATGLLIPGTLTHFCLTPRVDALRCAHAHHATWARVVRTSFSQTKIGFDTKFN